MDTGEGVRRTNIVVLSSVVLRLNKFPAGSRVRMRDLYQARVCHAAR